MSRFLLAPVKTRPARRIEPERIDELKRAAERSLTSDVTRRGSPLFYRVVAAMAVRSGHLGRRDRLVFRVPAGKAE